MKVLFAVNSENVSDAIIKKYQKDYREILSYKNVYYFDAIQKEIQKDKSYDRIVISVDLEPFSSNNYESIDKFIFEKLDGISDEAHDTAGNEITIILICSDRHTKGSSFLVKLFGLGIYNALLGNDKNIEEVCRLINKPRTKKEAKIYYKIDTDDVNYRTESEDEVDELQIQNILFHFRKLGKNTEKYASSFENIASQYTEQQLKIIINCLPANVKRVLEQTSTKYQEIMAASGILVQGVKSNDIADKEDQKRTGLKIDIIENKLNQTKMTQPIVIPNSVKSTSSSNAKKVVAVPQKIKDNVNESSEQSDKTIPKVTPELKTKKINENKGEKLVRLPNGKIVRKKVVPKTTDIENEVSVTTDEEIQVQPKTVKPMRKISNAPENPVTKPMQSIDEIEDVELPDFTTRAVQDSPVAEPENSSIEPVKRGRGRPRKNPVGETKPKGKRGRPRKNPPSEVILEEETVQQKPVQEEILQEEVVQEELPDLETITEKQLNFDSFDDNEFISGFDEDIENDDFADLLDDDEIMDVELPSKEIAEDDELGDLELDDLELPELDDIDDFDDEKDEFADLTEESFDEFDDYDEYGQYEAKSQASSKIENVDELYEEDILSDSPSDFEEEDDIQIPGLDDISDLDDFSNDIQDDLDFANDSQDDLDMNLFDDVQENIDSESILENQEDLDMTAEDDNVMLSDLDDENDILSDVDFDEEDDLAEFAENKEAFVEDTEVNDANATFEPSYSENEIPSQNDLDYGTEAIQSIEQPIDYSMSNLNSLMTKDKKIVTFIGSTKNGVSFLVNNLAEIFASVGINTAILDMTKNRNSYYIYTQNEESLRQIAYTSLEKLQTGIAEGIRVKQNLTVYTSLPNDGKEYPNAEGILSTLVQNHSLVLIDCDYDTNPSYFASCQEIYLVQSMDILTIQPLTAFLRDLKTQGVFEPEKARVVINKELKVKGLTNKAIIGGMSSYNDPAMSFMTELFDKESVKYCSIPFEEMAYSKYLEGMLNCKVSISGYSKNFMNKLRILGDMVYPLTSRQTYSSNSKQSYTPNNFSNSMNNTLNKMKKKY